MLTLTITLTLTLTLILILNCYNAFPMPVSKLHSSGLAVNCFEQVNERTSQPDGAPRLLTRRSASLHRSAWAVMGPRLSASIPTGHPFSSAWPSFASCATDVTQRCADPYNFGPLSRRNSVNSRRADNHKTKVSKIQIVWTYVFKLAKFYRCINFTSFKDWNSVSMPTTTNILRLHFMKYRN